ncbi:Phophatidylserine decarboxylase-domain-containing protein [Hypoxylon trugodes]|uniref:Phophatidylserine decarboxylase-domain-containing protein n=1 Tax=Hypoxylon trugodes TaxID=326681 RepID=UPI002194A8EB|nr:Phophatidylserine decarboxylase-domain-containing protein [Hypoxylon trugodes]KAI1382912.1 Phophatidylserine decarboxylase-domain-containing protein [Hypoxylon trugodes]
MSVPLTHRVGGWLPPDSDVLLHWVRRLVKEVDRRAGHKEFSPVVKDLRTLIESTPRLRMLASAMFDEVPDKDPYRTDPNGCRQVRDYHHMLCLFDIIVNEKAPEWSKTEYNSGLIGFPFNAILDWPMATPSGYAFFLDKEVNVQLRNVLNYWRDNVLKTSKSLYVVTKNEKGWLSDEATVCVVDDAGAHGSPFHDIFKCDLSDEDHWGFKSWDDFFVREFKDINVLRPVGRKDDLRWVVNSCESKPFSLQMNVKEYDTFWLKGQPYSVAEMMGHHENAADFVDGTVYQAFLSATSYHRWNSPVKGRVVHAEVIEGTYFSEPTITGFTNPVGPDPAAPDQAQGYITHVATRAMFLIEADDPKDGGGSIGLICAIYVGMADVSTCEIANKFKFPRSKPIAVEKGEELGMFHHGGSTHCLLFPKDLQLRWVTEAFPGAAKKNLPIRSRLVYVEKNEG